MAVTSPLPRCSGGWVDFRSFGVTRGTASLVKVAGMLETNLTTLCPHAAKCGRPDATNARSQSKEYAVCKKERIVIQLQKDSPPGDLKFQSKKVASLVRAPWSRLKMDRLIFLF